MSRHHGEPVEQPAESGGMPPGTDIQRPLVAVVADGKGQPSQPGAFMPNSRESCCRGFTVITFQPSILSLVRGYRDPAAVSDFITAQVIQPGAD